MARSDETAKAEATRALLLLKGNVTGGAFGRQSLSQPYRVPSTLRRPQGIG